MYDETVGLSIGRVLCMSRPVLRSEASTIVHLQSFGYASSSTCGSRPKASCRRSRISLSCTSEGAQARSEE